MTAQTHSLELERCLRDFQMECSRVGAMAAHFEQTGVLVLRAQSPIDASGILRLLAAYESETAANWGDWFGAHCVYWRSQDGVMSVSLGAVIVRSVMGDDRFAAVRRIVDEVPVLPQSTADARAVWRLGAAFSAGERAHPWRNWPDAQLVLPRWFVEMAPDGSAHVTCCVLTQPSIDWAAEVADCSAQLTSILEVAWGHGHTAHGEDDVTVVTPERAAEACDAGQSEAFRKAVAETAAEIRDGRYTKVVLARRADNPRPADLSLADVVRQLQARYPRTFVYAFHGADSWFAGASPERLVRLASGQTTVDCLAGTIATGSDEQNDADLAGQLLCSRKDMDEHQVVVRSITEALRDLVRVLQVPETPAIKKLRNVQHLWTEVTGDVRAGVTVLDLVERLHPTPAVAGVPRDVAVAVIQDRESMDRGWYAGPIGWLDDAGNGEFAVALRSALFTDMDVHLYAGAGIMGDSQPDAEWTETELKLQAMRAAIWPRA